MTKPYHATYTETETERRREAALQRMFATPHKPHSKKGGEPKPAAAKVKTGKAGDQ